MKIGLITDTHFGARNDSLAFLVYFEKFYDEVFFPELEKRGITTIIHLGDIVDRRKYISYTTLRKMKECFIQKCSDLGIELHVIIGNHDVPYKNTNEINAMQELFDTHDVKYYSEPTAIEVDGTEIMMMPWINASNYEAAMNCMSETSAQILFGHLELSGFSMHRGSINSHGMESNIFSKFDVVCSGHFHHRHTKGNITYLGCPYEMTWADYQDPKGFHIFDTETRELEFVRNPYSMFFKVFYNDTGKTTEEILDVDFSQYNNAYVKVVKQAVDNPYTFDLFIDALYKENPNNIQIVDDHLNLDLQDDSDIVDEVEDTVTILSKYIESLSDTTPKKELDGLMKSLYNEAITLGVDA